MEKLIGVVGESTGRQKQRRSERSMQFLSGEEMVLIGIGSQSPLIAKLLDLSEDGTLVYLSEKSEILHTVDTECTLTFYHDGAVFRVESKIARISRRLIGFEFVNPPSTVVKRVRAKIVQMADWVKG